MLNCNVLSLFTLYLTVCHVIQHDLQSIPTSAILLQMASRAVELATESTNTNRRRTEKGTSTTKTEKPHGEETDSSNLEEQILRQICLDNLRVSLQPSIPPPEKFHFGDDYHSWERAARFFLKRFKETDRPEALLSILSKEAADRVFEFENLNFQQIEDLFTRLRELLDTPHHALFYRSQFFDRRQLRGESTSAYATALKRLAVKAFPNDGTEMLQSKLLDRFVEGLANKSVKIKLAKKPPADLAAALHIAESLERLQSAAEDTPLPCSSITSSYTATNNPSRPFRRPFDGTRQWYPGRQFQTNMRGRRNQAPPVRQRNKPLGTSVIPVVRPSEHSQLVFLTPISIAGKKMNGLVDTGAACSLIDASIATTIPGVHVYPFSGSLIGADGRPIITAGCLTVDVELDHAHLKHELVLARNLTYHCIIGIDLLRAAKCVIDLTD